MNCNGTACYTKTAAFLPEITLNRSLSYENRSEPTRSKSHLLEMHILDLLLLLPAKTKTTHWLSILGSQGHFAYPYKNQLNSGCSKHYKTEDVREFKQV